MPIVASDLIAYSAVNRPSDDTTTGGGAITTLVRPVLSPLSAIDDIEAVSSSVSDTGDLTIVGRGTDGLLVTVPITLAGTTTVINATLFERILSVTYVTPANGTIQLRRRGGGPLICTVPAGEQGVSTLFKSAIGEAGVATRYDKFFFKNVHGSLTLSAAKVRLTADPAAKIRIGLAAAVNDTATIANRKTAPGGITFFDDNIDINLPGAATLAAGERIGVWVEQALAAAEAAFNSTFTVSITGTS
jgi:hypothetical protein